MVDLYNKPIKSLTLRMGLKRCMRYDLYDMYHVGGGNICFLAMKNISDM